MVGYMRHIFWLLLRPFVRPFWVARQQTVEEREEELQRYQREQKAALQELKIEFLLAKRQGMRDRTRQHREDEAGA